MKIEGGCLCMLVNDFLSYGQDLIDHFAGLLGRIQVDDPDAQTK